MMQPINYLMRGVRVEILSEDTIDFFANEAAKFLGVDKRTRKKMDTFMEMLEEYGIVIDIVADDEWLDITNAMCITALFYCPIASIRVFALAKMRLFLFSFMS